MASYLSRLREALQPEYELEREIASGGMGTVFLAREVALDRLVAVKIVRPEQSTADATERFEREAVTLAGLDHPNIVKVFTVGERGGFHYYTMQYLEGETLAERMRRKPLKPEEVRRIGRDLLDALEAAHHRNVVHRDIKPQNIFLKDGRAILVDFGISTASGPQTVAREGSEVVPGTPAYMPPEQRYGWDVLPQTDLYAVGMVLYEALTGRRWQWFLPDDIPDWSGIPKWTMLSPLQRALEFKAADRWESARAFRHSWWGRRALKYRMRAALLAASGLVAGGAAAFLLRPAGVEPADLVIPPFAVEGADARLGVMIAGLTYDYLHTNPGIVSVAPASQFGALDGGAPDPGMLNRFRTQRYTAGSVQVTGDSVTVTMSLVDREGVPTRIGAVSGLLARLPDLACRLGYEIVRTLKPAALDYECQPKLDGTPAQAIDLFLAGEEAFRVQDMRRADSLYTAALAIDPTFTWAHWRRLNARRWLRQSFPKDLDSLYQHHRLELPEIDRLLLDIWRTPFGEVRLTKYARALDRFPRDPYLWLMYGEDLFHRGALAGIALDSARQVLLQAVEHDPAMGPALVLLAWSAIRLGDADDAARWIERLRESERPNVFIPVDNLALAATERFGPEEHRSAMRAALLAQAGVGADGATDFREFVEHWLRFGLAFDAAPGQVWFADAALNDPSATDPGLRLHLMEARGLGLVAMGRLEEALATFDSIAAMSELPAARLQAAQWRVVPAALGLEGFTAEQAAEGRAMLGAIAAAPTVMAAVEWTLALDAYGRNDPLEGQRHLAALKTSAPSRADLIALIDALQQEALGRPDRALRLTDSIVPYWAEGAREPFLRSALFLKRGAWRADGGIGDPSREWIWYQNSDLRGWAIGPTAHVGEIDWALANHARLRLARLSTDRKDRPHMCRQLAYLVSTWTEADAALRAARTEADERRSRLCR